MKIPHNTSKEPTLPAGTSSASKTASTVLWPKQALALNKQTNKKKKSGHRVINKLGPFRPHLFSAPQGGLQFPAQLKGYPQHQCDLIES